MEILANTYTAGMTETYVFGVTRNDMENHILPETRCYHISEADKIVCRLQVCLSKALCESEDAVEGSLADRLTCFQHEDACTRVERGMIVECSKILPESLCEPMGESDAVRATLHVAYPLKHGEDVISIQAAYRMTLHDPL